MRPPPEPKANRPAAFRPIMSHLDELESHSIYLLREAYHAFERPAMLWSMGKDSNVLLWLAKKAFFASQSRTLESFPMDQSMAGRSKA